jgi:hypothetical protein
MGADETSPPRSSRSLRWLPYLILGGSAAVLLWAGLLVLLINVWISHPSNFGADGLLVGGNWTNVVPTVLGLVLLLLLALVYRSRSAAREPSTGDVATSLSSVATTSNGPRALPFPRRPPVPVRAVPSILVGVGILALLVLVVGGAVDQLGVLQCCNGYGCGPSPGVCPDSLVNLGITGFLMAGCAFLIAAGVFLGTTPPRARGSLARGSSGSTPVLLALLGPSLVSFGWGLTTLGLLLPWDVFGFCLEPCRYAYVLSGYPLGLVEGGVASLASGAVLLIFGAIRRSPRGGRPARSAARSPSIAP